MHACVRRVRCVRAKSSAWPAERQDGGTPICCTSSFENKLSRRSARNSSRCRLPGARVASWRLPWVQAREGGPGRTAGRVPAQTRHPAQATRAADQQAKWSGAMGERENWSAHSSRQGEHDGLQAEEAIKHCMRRLPRGAAAAPTTQKRGGAGHARAPASRSSRGRGSGTDGMRLRRGGVCPLRAGTSKVSRGQLLRRTDGPVCRQEQEKIGDLRGECGGGGGGALVPCA